MRYFLTALSFALVTFPALAQDAASITNSPVRPSTPATTNLFATNLVTVTNLFANTNGLVRNLGLMEAIRSSVSNNFDVRISRIDPLISATDVDSALGAYDPLATANGTHTVTRSDGGKDTANTVTAGLAGEVPGAGTTYKATVSGREASTAFPSGASFRQNAPGSAALSVRQPLLRNLWINSTRYNVEFSRKNLRISELGLRLRLLSTVSLVEQAYFDWIAARENVRVQEEAVTLARQQAREYGIRTQIGTARPLDQQRFESQAATSEAALLTARRVLKEQENRLIDLISTDFAAWHGAALEPLDQLPTLERSYDLQTSWSTAFQKRPDLHQFIIELERAGLTEKFRYNQIFPQLDLTGLYGYNGLRDSIPGTLADTFDANKPTWAVGLDASFPIGNRSARAGLRSARLQKQQADERLQQARQTIMVQVENAIVDARTGWERIPATRQAREFAASALRAGQLQLAAGTVTPLDILSLQQNLTAARVDEIRALVDYNKAVTVLLEREGTLLEERGLTLTAK